MGKDESGERMEIIEHSRHPFFIAAQFHPEFKSRPFKPSPLFLVRLHQPWRRQQCVRSEMQWLDIRHEANETAFRRHMKLAMNIFACVTLKKGLVSSFVHVCIFMQKFKIRKGSVTHDHILLGPFGHQKIPNSHSLILVSLSPYPATKLTTLPELHYYSSDGSGTLIHQIQTSASSVPV